jgi:hypothetical protein
LRTLSKAEAKDVKNPRSEYYKTLQPAQQDNDLKDDHRNYTTYDDFCNNQFLQNAKGHVSKITKFSDVDKIITQQHIKSLKALSDLNKLKRAFKSKTLKDIAAKLTKEEILDVFDVANGHGGYTNILGGVGEAKDNTEKLKRQFSVAFQKACNGASLFSPRTKTKGLRTKRMYEKFDAKERQEAVNSFISSLNLHDK